MIKKLQKSSPIFSIRRIIKDDYPKLKPKIIERWGSTVIITKGRGRDVIGLEGFIAETGNQVGGYIFFEFINNEIEITLLDSFRMKVGIGTALVKEVIELAKKRGVKRLSVITTNGNIYAIQFYQKIGFDIFAIHRNIVLEKKKQKPEIGLIGYKGIPVRHEIEFEYLL